MSLVRFRQEAFHADLAHLVERHLAKVEVAGSSPVIRLSRFGNILIVKKIRNLVFRIFCLLPYFFGLHCMMPNETVVVSESI